jgi:hypothetical protein
MSKRRHQHEKRSKSRGSSGTPLARPPVPTFEKKPVIQYGKPFIVLEDAQKATFVFTNSQWVPHDKTIAECRVDCQVKQLPQKINGMTRYEVCAPIALDA